MAKNHKYKNTSKQTVVVIGVGEVAPNGVIETDEPINVEGLEVVSKSSEARVGFQQQDNKVGVVPVTKPEE